MKTKRSALSIGGAMAMVLALAACSSGGGGGQIESTGLPPEPGEDQASVQVTNNARAEATLTAQIMGRRVRLGVLQPGRTETYFVEIRGREDVAVEIRLLGGGRCTTSPRPVSAGERINTIIPPDLSMMTDCR
jgi:hypothetical protein